MFRLRLVIIMGFILIAVLNPAIETFQGQRCLHCRTTGWVIQKCAGGELWFGLEWQRWTDSILHKIAGY